MSYRFADSFRAGSGWIWFRPDPARKFEKFVHLVGFVIRIYHDARSPEFQIEIYCWIMNFCFSNKKFNNTVFARPDVNKWQLSFKSST
jgi:hypothetical protein